MASRDASLKHTARWEAEALARQSADGGSFSVGDANARASPRVRLCCGTCSLQTTPVRGRLLATKPTAVKPVETITEEQAAAIRAELDGLSNRREVGVPPAERGLELPETSSQAYGWHAAQAAPVGTGRYATRARVACEETKYAATYYVR